MFYTVKTSNKLLGIFPSVCCQIHRWKINDKFVDSKFLSCHSSFSKKTASNFMRSKYVSANLHRSLFPNVFQYVFSNYISRAWYICNYRRDIGAFSDLSLHINIFYEHLKNLFCRSLCCNVRICREFRLENESRNNISSNTNYPVDEE